MIPGVLNAIPILDDTCGATCSSSVETSGRFDGYDITLLFVNCKQRSILCLLGHSIRQQYIVGGVQRSVVELASSWPL